MASTTSSIHNSPLFNKVTKGQLPSQNMSPCTLQKSVEAPVNQSLILEEIYGSVRKPRNFKQWEDAARQNTQKIQEQGSLSPLIWVLVKGKDIPLNAIVAGEERRQPLYIARTFYEGGLCIGKAGRHLERGAAIPYNGLEVQVESYEVLVPASLQPLRYSVSSTVQMPIIPRIVGSNLAAIGIASVTSNPPATIQVDRGFQGLNMIKTVILVDDSASMAGALWGDAREALAGITDMTAQVSNDGVDVYFMNDHRFATNCSEGNEVRKLFDSVYPCGETPIGRKLQELFEKYIPLIENKNLLHRPITIVVITDGVPTDEPTDAIVDAARRLDRTKVPLQSFRVQFVQIGDDPEATEALEELDNNLSGVYIIRDMVDATPHNPNSDSFTSESLVGILLGGINGKLDHLVLSPGSNKTFMY